MTDTSTVTPSPVSPAVEACKRDRMKETLGYAAVATLILIIVLLFVKGMPTGPEAATIFGMIVSAVLLNVKEVYGFVFGSSQGSQDKTSALAASMPAPTPPPAQ